MNPPPPTCTASIGSPGRRTASTTSPSSCDVGELEVRRVVQVDVGVAEVVEHQRRDLTAAPGRAARWRRSTPSRRRTGRRPARVVPAASTATIAAGGDRGAGRRGRLPTAHHSTTPVGDEQRRRGRCTTGVVGNWATRMNPVPNTPTSEPAVPSADSRPTTRPVWSTVRQLQLDDQRRDGAEQGRREEEGERRQHDDRRRP